MKKLATIVFLLPLFSNAQFRHIDSAYLFTDSSVHRYYISDNNPWLRIDTGIRFYSVNNKIKLKRYIPSAVCFFISGCFDGVMDYLQFHYSKPNQFWNPDISWTNKYKNHDPAQGEKFPGSTSVFVWTQDGWHLCKFSKNAFLFTGVVLNPWKKERWYIYALKGLSYWVIHKAGFNIMFHLLKTK